MGCTTRAMDSEPTSAACPLKTCIRTVYVSSERKKEKTQKRVAVRGPPWGPRKAQRDARGSIVGVWNHRGKDYRGSLTIGEVGIRIRISRKRRMGRRTRAFGSRRVGRQRGRGRAFRGKGVRGIDISVGVVGVDMSVGVIRRGSCQQGEGICQVQWGGHRPGRT